MLHSQTLFRYPERQHAVLPQGESRNTCDFSQTQTSYYSSLETALCLLSRSSEL